MNQDQIILFALMGGVLGLLLWGRFRYDLVAFCALTLAVILVAGVVPAKDAFCGLRPSRHRGDHHRDGPDRQPGAVELRQSVDHLTC